MSMSGKNFGAHRIDLTLSLPLRRVFYKLLDGASFRDERGYAVVVRIAGLLTEIEREIGFNGVKRIMRRLERLEALKKRIRRKGGNE
jgi:hypothetical protein